MARTLQEIQQLINDFIEERNWSQFHNPKDLAISLNLEAAEVLEHFQWKTEAEVAHHTKAQKQAIAEELADTMYCILLMAQNLDIDITEAMVAKMAKNRRKYPVAKSAGNHKKYTDNV